MEKDIKILEWLIELWKHNGEMERETQAIENLLKRYKELEEENKRLIIAKAEALQEMRKYKAKAKNLKEQNKGLIESNKEWLRVYSELEEKNAMLKKANNIAEDVTVEDITQVMNKSLEEFKRDYIPISVIQNTLDNTNKNIEEFTRNVVTTKEEIEQEYWKSELNKAIAKRNVLQEILEKGNK